MVKYSTQDLEIIEEREKAILVSINAGSLASSGRTMWLPLSQIEILPGADYGFAGRVIAMPNWLAKAKGISNKYAL